jgi:LacI family transcriptional regulator
MKTFSIYNMVRCDFMPNNDNKITILDIAEKADVSPSTVSRVLRNSAGVAQPKREAVLQAVSELDYRPNIFAQSLASGQSMTIGVLTQNFGSPMYDAIMRGVIMGLQGSAYSPIFADGQWQTAVERRIIQTLINRRVDGLVIVGGQLPFNALSEIEKDLPLIIVARAVPELPERCIFTDNFRGAYEATKFLIEYGHRKIVHITGDPIQEDAVRRLEGYRQALGDAGIEFNPALVIEGSFRRQSGVLAVETLIARGQTFSAIFAANDQMAFGARLALFRRGIRVPDDVSLIGYDDQSDSAYMIPPLTTMRQPAAEMGKAAAHMLLDILKGEAVEIPEFQSELVIRESVMRIF